jgi:hypothetical protein
MKWRDLARLGPTVFVKSHVFGQISPDGWPDFQLARRPGLSRRPGASGETWIGRQASQSLPDPERVTRQAIETPGRGSLSAHDAASGQAPGAPRGERGLRFADLGTARGRSEAAGHLEPVVTMAPSSVGYASRCLTSRRAAKSGTSSRSPLRIVHSRSAIARKLNGFAKH